MKKIGSANVVIDGSDDFEEKTGRIVEQIARSKTGQAVIKKIRAHGVVLIRPWTKQEMNAVAKSNPILGIIGIIEFSPSTWETIVIVHGIPMPNHVVILNPGFKPDEVLLHEMVHAGRVLGGDLKTIKLKGAMKDYDNEEEFFAVLIANIYLSEKGTPSTFLRPSHRLGGILAAAKQASEAFLFVDDNYRLIEKLCDQQPIVTKMLRDVPGRFNPIRAYYESREIKFIDPEIISVPYRITQKEVLPALTDDYLISILKPRFHASDVAGYGARARKLEQVFGSLKSFEAFPLFTRLTLRPNGDVVAGYFHHHLATQTRNKLLEILRGRLAQH